MNFSWILIVWSMIAGACLAVALIHFVAGKPNRQTGAELGTVEKTVKVHRARIMQKLQVQSLAGLVQLAVRAGITLTPEN